MEFDWNVIATLVAPVFALLVGYWLRDILKKKPKLLYRMTASEPVTLIEDPDNPLTMQMCSLSVVNAGKAPTSEVRIGHKTLPAHSVSPVTAYKIETLADKGKEIIFPRLLGNEEITITYLYSPPLKWQEINTHVKSNDAFGEAVREFPPPPQPFMKQWVLPIITFAAFAATTVSLGDWFMQNVLEIKPRSELYREQSKALEEQLEAALKEREEALKMLKKRLEGTDTQNTPNNTE